MKRFLLLMMIPMFLALTIWHASARTLKLFPSKWVGVPLMTINQKNYSADMAAKILITKTGTPVIVITSTPLENGEVYHVVQLHEALWSIAIAYHTTIDNLKQLNGLSSDEIFAGQKLLVFKPEPNTVTPTTSSTATFGIPTSTATHPVTSTITPTLTPLPTPPVSQHSGELAVGIIILIALLSAGMGSWLGRKKPD
ncbi:MAG: LysM peptidoglycan-binding domain-containing protein [Chloroflexi bacterium]|nr:LysM peptidoglycan-binding domain-containing protein [Chloroflexota bacterium]